MSKLNPQKASAYVGPGVLRKGGKITPVPNGPLIKKKGPFKGSTLKTGGTIKKAANGTTTKQTTTPPLSPYMQKRAAQDLVKQKNIRARDSILQRNANAQGLTREEVRARQEKDKKKPDVSPYGSNTISLEEARCGDYKETSKKGCGIAKEANRENSKQDFRKNGGPIKKAQTGGTYYASSKGRVGRLSGSKIGDDISAVKNESIDTTGYAKGKKDFTKTINRTFEKPTAQKVKRADVPKVISNLKKGATRKMDLRTLDQRKKSKMKTGGMIKRADGSMSKRGLWDNLRANKGSGKKPTKQMLVQEKKIKAKSKK